MTVNEIIEKGKVLYEKLRALDSGVSPKEDLIIQACQALKKLQENLKLSESQNYCKMCGKTLDGYQSPTSYQ